MIKVKVIKEFTLSKFNELKNIERVGLNQEGKLFIGDTFECDKEMADYLSGNNASNVKVIDIIEVIPEEPKIEKPRKRAKKK